MLPSSNPVVLVADDEPSMLELVAQHLKTLDDPALVVLEASDGEQAWKLAREHLPDLVVLDVMMPGMSGWEVCRKIREDVALAHTGVVMLTGIGENLNQMTSPLYGADAYIDKPFDFEELDEKVKAALSARAAQREAVQRPAKNVNGVAGPAKAAKASHEGSPAPHAKSAKGTKTPRAGGAGAQKSPTAKAGAKSAAEAGATKAAKPTKTNKRSDAGSPKTKAAAKAKAQLSNKSKPKPMKGETKMAAKKTAKKGAKKAAKKTAKKAAKKKAK